MLEFRGLGFRVWGVGVQALGFRVSGFSSARGSRLTRKTEAFLIPSIGLIYA